MPNETTTTYTFKCNLCKAELPAGRISFCATCEADNWHYCPGYTVYGGGIYSIEQEVPDDKCQMYTTNGPGDRGLCNHCTKAKRHVCVEKGCRVTLPKKNPNARCEKHTFSFGMASYPVARVEKIYGEGWQVAWYTRRAKKPFYTQGRFKTEAIANTLLKALLNEEGYRAWNDRDYIEMVAVFLRAGNAAEYFHDDDVLYADDGWGEVTFLGYGDYHNTDLLNESNTEVLYEEWSKAFPGDVEKRYQGYGSVDVLVNVLNVALMQAIYEEKQRLDNYMVVDEEDWSRREWEAKEKYFNEDVYKAIQEYALGIRHPLLTAVFRMSDGTLERQFIDVPDIKYAIQIAAEEYIVDDGGQMFMSDDYIPKVIERALGPDNWSRFDITAIRERVERLRRWLAQPRNDAVQATFLPLVHEGQSFYDPSQHELVRVVDPEGELTLELVPRHDGPEAVYVSDR